MQVLCHCHWQPDRQNALTVIIVHGLEGSSESPYMLGIAAKGTAAGMNVVRMNQRNCGGTDALSPTLYHSGRSQDIAAVAQNLIEQDGISRFALAGFSMGGNLVLKLAGEWGREGPPQFRAVAAVCPSMDLPPPLTLCICRATASMNIYFMWKLRRRLRAKARLFPGSLRPVSPARREQPARFRRQDHSLLLRFSRGRRLLCALRGRQRSGANCRARD